MACRQAGGQELVLAGGNDKTLTAYKFDGKLTKLWSNATPAPPRSLDVLNDIILMGLKNGSIMVMPCSDGGA